MPELPEVETVCRELAPVLKKRRLEGVQIFDPKLRAFRWHSLRSQSVRDVFRIGKFVVLQFSNRSCVAVHLRMTGRLIWEQDSQRRDSKAIMVRKSAFSEGKGTRAIFAFKGGQLVFSDTRRFGTIQLFAERESIPCKGMEPLDPGFTSESFERLRQRSKQSIKQFLLRQDRIVGIGNIYASEILYRCQIHPARTVDTLSARECELIVRFTKEVLLEAIENCGTTFSDFQRTHGEIGSFQEFLAVYDREALPCPRCHARIERIVQQQRSTYFCPKCQRAPKSPGKRLTR